MALFPIPFVYIKDVILHSVNICFYKVQIKGDMKMYIGCSAHMRDSTVMGTKSGTLGMIFYAFTSAQHIA